MNVRRDLRAAAMIPFVALCLASLGGVAAQELEPPQGLTCLQLYGRIVELSWTNPASYDQVRVTRHRVGSEPLDVLLDGAAQSVLLSATGYESGAVISFDVRGEVDSGGASPTVSCSLEEGPKNAFIRGDANRDGTVSISDVATLDRSLFVYEWEGIHLHGSMPPCVEAADTNDDDKFDIVDSVYILQALFQGGPVFPEPFPIGARDERPGSLSCVEPQGAAPELDESFVIEVGEVEGAPGQVVRVPILATTPVEVDGFSLALEYDPAQVEIQGISFAGTVYEDRGIEVHYRAAEPAGPGQVVIGVINNFIDDVRLPPLDDGILLQLDVKVLETAGPGAAAITPHGGIGNVPVENEFSILGTAAYAATYPLLLEGAIQIVVPGNVDYFRRGDGNGDGKVDISDPVATLGFLFLGSALECRDAADADDDGELVITDAIRVLGDLFLGESGRIAPPFPGCGTDPSDDSLTCLTRDCI